MVSTDPLRVEIAFREGDDEIRWTYAEDLAVVDVAPGTTAEG